MVQPYHPYRKPRDVGSESPAHGEAKRQRIAGERGGRQEARPRPTAPRQPAQTSGRRSARHLPLPAEPKKFAREEDPSRQGRGRPRLERVKMRSRLQGHEPRSGSHSAHAERVEEEAMRGIRRGARHAWRGRQHVGPTPPGGRRRRRGHKRFKA